MKHTALAYFLVALLAAAAHGVTQSQASKQEPKPAAKETTVAGDARKGKSLYADHCEICHYAANRAKKVGPGLKGIYKRGKFADGKKVDDTTMRQWIQRGGKDMPAFEETLTKEQVEHLMAYLKTL